MQVGMQQDDSVDFVVMTEMAGLKRMLLFAVSEISDRVPRTVTHKRHVRSKIQIQDARKSHT